MSETLLLLGGIIVHEAGHAAVAHVYRLRVGLFIRHHGLILGITAAGPTRRQSAFIALAGPLLSIYYGLLVLPYDRIVGFGVIGAYGLLQMLPVRPFDGSLFWPWLVDNLRTCLQNGEVTWRR